MAHADYNCCAICDRKMDYNAYDAKSKADVCPECREEHGIATVSQLVEKIKEDPESIEDLPIKYCHYPNEVDLRFYMQTGREAPDSSWAKGWLPFYAEKLGEEES